MRLIIAKENLHWCRPRAAPAARRAATPAAAPSWAQGSTRDYGKMWNLISGIFHCVQLWKTVIDQM